MEIGQGDGIQMARKQRQNTEGKDRASEASEEEAKKSGKIEKKMIHKNATRNLYYLKIYYKILCFS